MFVGNAVDFRQHLLVIVSIQGELEGRVGECVCVCVCMCVCVQVCLCVCVLCAHHYSNQNPYPSMPSSQTRHSRTPPLQCCHSSLQTYVPSLKGPGPSEIEEEGHVSATNKMINTNIQSYIHVNVEPGNQTFIHTYKQLLHNKQLGNRVQRNLLNCIKVCL